jgi:hypothetical protein
MDTGWLLCGVLPGADEKACLDAACSRKPVALRKERRRVWDVLLDKLSAC